MPSFVCRRALSLSIIVSILALASGCGSRESVGNTPRSSSEVAPAASPPPTTTKTAKKKAKEHNEKTAGGWSEAVVPPYDVSKADVHRQSRDICKLFTPKQVAAEYHSKPDAVSAALKYAKVSYKPVFQQPAFEGCLSGFKK